MEKSKQESSLILFIFIVDNYLLGYIFLCYVVYVIYVVNFYAIFYKIINIEK